MTKQPRPAGFICHVFGNGRADYRLAITHGIVLSDETRAPDTMIKADDPAENELIRMECARLVIRTDKLRTPVEAYQLLHAVAEHINAICANGVWPPPTVVTDPPA